MADKVVVMESRAWWKKQRISAKIFTKIQDAGLHAQAAWLQWRA